VVNKYCCVNVIRANKDSNDIHIYDGRGSSDFLYTFDKLHNNPVVMMKVMCSVFEYVVNFLSVSIFIYDSYFLCVRQL